MSRWEAFLDEAEHHQLEVTTRCVALALALFDDARASVYDLARVTTLSVSAARACLRALEASGMIRHWEHADRPSLYALVRPCTFLDPSQSEPVTHEHAWADAEVPRNGAHDLGKKPLALDKDLGKSGSGPLDRSSPGVAVAKITKPESRESGSESLESKDLAGSSAVRTTPVTGVFFSESQPLRLRFVPKDWAPTERQLHRMQYELKWSAAKQRDVVGSFRVHEFQVPVTDWSRRFAKWIEEQRMRDEAKRAR